MKRTPLILFVFILVTFQLLGCGKVEKNPNKAIDYLKNLNSYTCNVKVHIKNNKQELETDLKQFYSNKYGHRLDIGNDRIIIYREKDMMISDLNANREYSLDKDFDKIYKLSFIQEYIGLLYTNETIENSFKTIKDKEYQLISLIIPGNNRNLKKAIMYINLENNYPEKISIYDFKDNEILSYIYLNFEPNIDIPENIFIK